MASLAQAGLVSLPIAPGPWCSVPTSAAPRPALGGPVAGWRGCLPLGQPAGAPARVALLVLPWLQPLAQPANAPGGAAVWFHSAFNLAL
ncbi:hypothetical protein ACPA9J_04265 [Pseudomonas aeruginosa]